MQKNSSDIWHKFGAMDRRLPAFVLALLFLIILSLLVTMIVKINTINDTFPPRDKHIRVIIQEVTESHLWFEEILSGDTTEDLDEVLQQQEMAVTKLEQLLNGSTELIPLTDDEQIKTAQKAVKELQDFNKLTFARLEESGTSAAGSALDSQYDEQYKMFIATARALASQISKDTFDEFELFGQIQRFSVLMEILSFTIATIVLWNVGKRRDDALSGLLKQSKQQEQVIEERTQALEKQLEEVKRTQAQMIEQEKMAALGHMVAGVAHEINTPIGNGYVSTTHFSEITRNLKRNFEEGKVTRKEFEKYIDVSQQIADSITINLQRASELVQSFKRISIDQSNYDNRQLPIKPYLDEIVLSLRNILKQQHHAVHIDCGNDVTLYTCPGAWAQILTNLIQNSVIHGFEGMTHGNIRIGIDVSEEQATIDYRDDGCGVPEEHLGNLFEPFFTSKKRQGGSGLGLAVTYNIVQGLGGDIRCENNPDKGLRFVITLPLLPAENTEHFDT